MSGVPYTFASVTSSVPLSQLDANFATPVTIGTTTVGLGNTTTTLAGLSNVSTTVTNTSNVASNGSLLLQTNGSTTAVTIDTSQNVSLSGGGYLLTGITSVQNSEAQLSTNLYLSGAYDLSNKRSYQLYVDSNGALNFAKTGSYSYATLPSSGTYSTAMLLDTSGNLLINRTSQASISGHVSINGGGGANAGLYIDGWGSGISNGISLNTTVSSSSQALAFTYNGTQVGSIATTSSVTVYNTMSDARLKNLIGIATDTSVIDNIVVNDFTWKVDGSTDRGVFAQDAIHIKPSAIHQGKDDLDEHGLPTTPWGVDYSKFVPDLIVYCQQLKKQVTTLQSQVAALTPKS